MAELVLGGKKIRVEANASTLIIYEDRFKGRRLLRDLCELIEIENHSEVPFSLVSKMLWAVAKTADSSIGDYYDWCGAFSIGDIVAVGYPVIALLAKSVETTKKAKAAAGISRLWRRLTSSLTRQSAG